MDKELVHKFLGAVFQTLVQKRKSADLVGLEIRGGYRQRLYSPATQERVSVEAGAGEVSEDRARLLEFQIGT